MTAQQLELEVPDEVIHFIQVCHRCDAIVAAIPSPKDGPWDEAEKWAYIEQKLHEQERCPGKEPPA